LFNCHRIRVERAALASVAPSSAHAARIGSPLRAFALTLVDIGTPQICDGKTLMLVARRPV
jgi:hypothetical protein